MAEAKKNPAARTAVGTAAGPYTHRRGERQKPERTDGERTVVNSAEWEAIRALDRKLTDGLNLVHEEFGVMRQERLEDRQEFREFRTEVRQEFRAVREEMQQEFKAVRGEMQQEFKAVRGEMRQEFTAVRGEMRQEFTAVREEAKREANDLREETRADIRGLREEFAVVHARLDKLEEAIRELSAQVGTLLERSRGTRRLVWGVLGTLGLLAAGGVLRPVFDRLAAALVGG